jgi:hypothetical protein
VTVYDPEMRIRMELERWVDDPFSNTETWLVNDCLMFTIDRREVIEMSTTIEFGDFLRQKLAPLVFLSVPVHDPSM